MKRRITGSHAERNACVIVSVPHLDGASVNEHTEDQKRKRGRLSGEMDDCSEGNDESSCQTDFDTVDAIESLLRTDSLVQLLDHVYCVEQLLHFLQGRTGEAGEEWNKIQRYIDFFHLTI